MVRQIIHYCFTLSQPLPDPRFYFFLKPDGHFGFTAVTVLVAVPFTQVIVVCFVKPVGHFGLTPVTFLTWEPLAQLMVVCF